MSLIDYFDDTHTIFDDLESNNKEIGINKIVFSPFSQFKCINCGMYARNWHCANNPDYITAKKIFSRFKSLNLLWVKMNCSKRRDNFKIAYPKFSKYTLNLYTGRQVFAILKKKLSDDVTQIYQYETNSGSKYKRDFLLFGPGGGCTKCRVCSLLKEKKEKCQKPGESFPSIESWGIDVYKTLSLCGIDVEVPPVDVYIVVGMYLKM